MTTTATTTAATVEPVVDNTDLMVATYILVTRAEQFPELRRTEAQARLKLAAAIQAMDEIEDLAAAGHKVHSLAEQAEVERAKDTYAQALADLLRGQGASCSDS